MINIGTEVTISAAHFVQTVDESPCYNLHGHNWRVEIEAMGEIKMDGMVADFSIIKKIIRIFDHKMLIPTNSRLVQLKITGKDVNAKINIYDDLGNRVKFYSIPKREIASIPVSEITAEQLAEYWSQMLYSRFAEHNILFRVRVWESEHSWAEASEGLRVEP